MTQSKKEVARPFLKWCGGKTKLLPVFESLYPKEFSWYIEPFLGGGAVFFHLWNLGKLGDVILGDSNSDLVNVYREVRDRPRKLSRLLQEHKDLHSKEHYYEVRGTSPTSFPSRVAAAARFLYLNKTCFNGLYRVNRKGGFNVPFGQYKNPEIFNQRALLAASKALQGAKIFTDDFREIVGRVEPGDFVYLDPPYHSESASFTSYTANRFGEQDQQDLAWVCRRLDRLGCYWMLSNNDTKLIRKLYRKWNFTEVSARRTVDPKGDRKKPVSELVIRNYK